MNTVLTFDLELFGGKFPKMICFVPDDSLVEGEFPGGENIRAIDHSEEEGQEEAEVEQCDVKGVERTHVANSESMKTV